MKRGLAIALVARARRPGGAARGPQDEDDEEAASDEDERRRRGAARRRTTSRRRRRAKPKPTAKDEGGRSFEKQDLSGHDVEHEQDARTCSRRIGSSSTRSTPRRPRRARWSRAASRRARSSTPRAAAQLRRRRSATRGAKFSRLFTELRLQTDFRHIGGGRWDARIDARAPLRQHRRADDVAADAPPRRTAIQSGFNGTNEYDIRELWLVRSGKRSDLFFGRQFIPDLGGAQDRRPPRRLREVRASSRCIGFGGLYPLRGSRSLDDRLHAAQGRTTATRAGRFVGAGGFGAAYRTINVLRRVRRRRASCRCRRSSRASTPRRTATAAAARKLDLYHFAVVDLSARAGRRQHRAHEPVRRRQLQAESSGCASPASFNRVDTETLNVQADAFLQRRRDGRAGSAATRSRTRRSSSPARDQRRRAPACRRGSASCSGSRSRRRPRTGCGRRSR